MRWIILIIVIVLVLFLQTSVLPPLGLGPQRIIPDLMIMLAVILAFHGEKGQALCFCWLIGALKDITGQAPLGCNAFAFGMIALFIVALRGLFYGRRPVTLMVFTFVLTFILQAFELVFIHFKQAMPLDDIHSVITPLLYTALFSAVLSPYLNWIMLTLYDSHGSSGRRKTFG